jgi:hypothetical protein
VAALPSGADDGIGAHTTSQLLAGVRLGDARTANSRSGTID